MLARAAPELRDISGSGRTLQGHQTQCPDLVMYIPFWCMGSGSRSAQCYVSLSDLSAPSPL
eukprot:5380656-Pyramimonas_sp.AAC.1